MSTAIKALQKAIECEQAALEQYKIASDHAEQPETKEALKEYLADKEQKIDTLSWMVMAETGTLERTETAPQNGAEKLASGKCPFSGELAKMGIDIDKMKTDPSAH